MPWSGPLNKVSDQLWEIPVSYKKEMRVPGRIYASERMLQQIKQDNALDQVANVATLPGIVGASLAMPDIHWGYGFPIGGVAAFDLEEGVISPGGVGFDINCGVRLIRTNLTEEDVRPVLDELTDVLFEYCPSGVGEKSRVRFSGSQIDTVLEHGVPSLVDQGLAWDKDVRRIEHGGFHDNADASFVSAKAKERGRAQVGSLGAGNHFLEVQRVAQIFDERVAKAFGVTEPGQVCVMVHSGSRGCGHQICTDYLKDMERADEAFTGTLVDRQLACAPVGSRIADEYEHAMCCAINFAFSNRQVLTHQARASFAKVFGRDADELGMDIVYDVAHNIAKRERHNVDGSMREVMVHRKGATRAYPAGSPDIPPEYADVGQPVLIPGDMGRCSYLLAGAEGSMRETFGSTCHGAGREMSRTAATKKWRGEDLVRDLRKRGIIVKAASLRVAAEEAPLAYKDVTSVVDVCHAAGISKKVAKLEPMGVIKG